MMFAGIALSAAVLALWTLSTEAVPALVPIVLALIAAGAAWITNNRLAAMRPISCGDRRSPAWRAAEYQ